MYEILIPSHTVPYSVAVIMAISGKHHTRPSPKMDVSSKSVVSRTGFDTADHGKPAVQVRSEYCTEYRALLCLYITTCANTCTEQDEMR